MHVRVHHPRAREPMQIAINCGRAASTVRRKLTKLGRQTDTIGGECLLGLASGVPSWLVQQARATVLTG